MLAERTYKILGKLVSLIDITANLADKAFLALGLRLRLNVLLIIGICHCLGVRNNPRLGDRADKHSVGVEVNILLNLERHKRVDVSRQEGKSVIRTKRCDALKLIRISAASEAEVFKHAERCVNRKTVDIHFARLLDNMVRIVVLIDRYGNPVRRVCNL